MGTRTSVLDGLRNKAREQRRRFAGRNVRIRRTHAGAPGPWLAAVDAEIVTPMCGAAPGHGFLDALHPTDGPVDCHNCQRMLTKGEAPAGWVGGPEQLALFELP